MDASLVYRTEPKTKKQKREITKSKTGYAQKKWCRTRKHGVSQEEGKGSLKWKGLEKLHVFPCGYLAFVHLHALVNRSRS